MGSRPLDELCRDACKAVADKVEPLSITQEELRMLKDYELVIGTGFPGLHRGTTSLCGCSLRVREEGGTK